MNSLDTRDPLERMLCEALRADAERAPQLPTEWIAPTASSITDAWIDGPLVAVDFGDEQPVGQRRRSAWPLVVAAAVVAIVVGVLILDAANDGAEPNVPAERPATVAPDTTGAGTMAIAERFMDAWVAGDGEAVVALFGPGGNLVIGPFGGYRGWPNGIEGHART